MNELEVRVRMSLHAVAEQLPDPPAASTQSVHVPTRRRLLSGPAALLAAAVAVLVIVGVPAWLLTGHVSPPPSSPASPGTIQPPTLDTPVPTSDPESPATSEVLCTLIACKTHLEVEVADGDVPDGPVVISVCIGNDCYTGTAPADTEFGTTPGIVTDPRLHDTPFTFRVYPTTVGDLGAETVTVVVTDVATGAIVADFNGQVNFERVTRNGPDCPPCFIATLTI